MAFHLTRETGKVIRIVSRGSQSFATILRMACFNIIPTLIEIIMTLTIISVLFPVEFFALASATITLYVVATICITEWRAKAFKRQALSDTRYIQKATDSLLNFETVKYFNAEDHELERFATALGEYKTLSVAVANGLVILNMSQSFIIASGLTSILLLGYQQILNGQL
jgi:ABC-type transport system involved in Fe-S cluster assembly fused permease/ATPase subunit